MRKALLHIIVLVMFAACETKQEEPAKTERPPKGKTKIDTAKLYDSVRIHEIKSAGDTERQPKTKTTPSPQPERIQSISALWAAYKSAKDKADNALQAGNLEETIKYLKIAGEAAVDLARPGIAAWQFNNIGHYSIEKFIKETDYENRIRTLATIETGDEKTRYLNETKELFRNYFPLLERAERHLVRAQVIDDELEKSRRTEVIESNVEFIAWIKDFLED